MNYIVSNTNFMNLNGDILYLIAKQYPSVALSLTNQVMYKMINKVFDSAVQMIITELPSINNPSLIHNLDISKMKYFMNLVNEMTIEAKRLGIQQPDFPNLSPADQMISGYFGFRQLIEKIKSETQKVQEQDFNKFIQAVAAAIDYPILPDQDLQEVWKTIKEKHLEERVESLNLDQQNMRFLPPEIGCLKNLKELSISHNQLKSLPIEINSLSLLKDLSLDHNQIAVIPDNIQLPHLESFKLRNNNLEQAPNLKSYPKLKHLYLHSNKIKDIPLDVDSHPSLQVIYLRGNPIENIPNPLSSRVEVAVVQFDSKDKTYKHLISDRFESI